MTRLLRYFCALAITIVCFSSLASADIKIKTRTTVMGHTTESTVYIKGARERNETSYGGHGGTVSIIQCDQKRMITISGDQCMIMSMGGEETLSYHAKHGSHGTGGPQERNPRFRARVAL